MNAATDLGENGKVTYPSLGQVTAPTISKNPTIFVSSTKVHTGNSWNSI
jgi:hypothetical protein